MMGKKYKKKILMRFDDICPTMDYKQWNKAVEVLDKYHIKPLIGVIPDCKDPELSIESPREDFWEYIKQLSAKGYAIAMHGYQHLYDIECRGLVNSSKNSEFAGHSYEIQVEKIKKGKEILEMHGVKTNIFFAPSHSYDDNTLRALKENGFKYVSDGKTLKLIIRHGIICVPCRTGGVPKIGKKGLYTAVFHAHEWSRPEKARGYDNLVFLCERYSDQIVSFNEFVNEKKGNYFIQSLDEKIYIAWSRYLRPNLYKVYERIKK